MHDPCEIETCKNDANCMGILDKIDNIILLYFVLEMLIKMTAMGIWGKLGYLGDSWNRLDFFITVSLTAIRAIRVLRPLRAINRIPSLRILVMLLLDTLPMLGNVLLLCFFVFFIFGIIAVQMWSGILRQRCFMPAQFYQDLPLGLRGKLPEYYKLNNSETNEFGESEKEFICSTNETNGLKSCSAIPASMFIFHNNTSTVCNRSYVIGEDSTPTEQGECINWNQYYNDCRAEAKNPYKGAINFDNIGAAWVAIFQVILFLQLQMNRASLSQ
ncbi:Voltage-dependent T-type calcium channel subunit alpha-1H [Cichlidogyrus casuarinus]|uniref:Voltage-dependent T-type calcium channel subunit alpha-1H n=1 Tax=Cichlidogyrus casuarinus TaxID=1844966 RepID=A0ABD2QME0_9PLAT